MKQIRTHINTYIAPAPEDETEEDTEITASFLQKSSSQLDILKFYVDIMDKYGKSELAEPLIKLQSLIQNTRSRTEVTQDDGDVVEDEEPAGWEVSLHIVERVSENMDKIPDMIARITVKKSTLLNELMV